MKLLVCGSSSAGNCYLLIADNGETLMLDCGVNPTDVYRLIHKFQPPAFRKISAALVTHEHADHAKFARNWMVRGVPVYASRGTSTGGKFIPSQIVSANNQYSIGNFRIIPFCLEHDAIEPLGFLVNHPESGTICYLTDTHTANYTFRGINQFLIEANYSRALIESRLTAGQIEGYRRDRIYKSHLSLENCIALLDRHDLAEVHNIVLIHLSAGNSNAAEFQHRVNERTGKAVSVADTGLYMDFNRLPF